MSKNDTTKETIEQKITRLEKSVAWFSSDEFVLSEAMQRYDDTQKLADEIQGALADMKLEIERVDEAK